MSSNKLWTRDFVFASIINFLINFGLYVTMVDVVDYATVVLGASMVLAGLASGAFILGALVARLGIGAQVEHLGTKRVLLVGLGTYAVALLANILVASIGGLVVLRILQGFGFGLASTSLGTIVAQIVPDARKGEGMSYYAVFLTLGSAVGPYASSLVYHNGDMSPTLLLALVSVLASVVLALPIEVHGAPQGDAPQTSSHTSKKRGLGALFDRKALPISVVMFFMALGWAFVSSFLSSFCMQTGLSAYAGTFYVAYALFTVVSRLFTGKLFDQRGANFVFYPTFPLFTAALLLLAFASSGWQVVLSGALVGLGPWWDWGTVRSSPAPRRSPSSSPIPHTLGLPRLRFSFAWTLPMGWGRRSWVPWRPQPGIACCIWRWRWWRSPRQRCTTSPMDAGPRDGTHAYCAS